MKNKAITPNPSDPADLSVTLSCQQYQRPLITLTWTPDLCPQLMEIFDQVCTKLSHLWNQTEMTKNAPKPQANNKDKHLEVSVVALNTMLCKRVKYNLSSASRHSKGIKIFVFSRKIWVPFSVWQLKYPDSVLNCFDVLDSSL